MNKKRILCVDDTYENLEILLELLKDYDVVVALNAQKALKILSRQHVDMILLDIMMPKVDGFMLAKEIKKDKNLKDIPILFISAKSDEQTIEKGYEIGGVDYVNKPFKPKELLARVKTHLKLSALVHNLEDEVEKSLQLQKQQEHLLIQQSYAASLGEMIDVVAHQWKQPLNVLNMRISNMLFDQEDGMIDDEYVKNFQDKALNQIRYLVNTLNDFRSFMAPNTKKELFSAQDVIRTAMVLIKDELSLHKIKVDINKLEDFTIDAIENEFIHILINIINNAKEVLIIKKIESPIIEIKVDENTKKIIISDNGGGIKEAHIDKIFELHVTSKKSTGGSGLGLYMSQMIIQKYGGTIEAKNSSIGAEFSLCL